MDFLITFSDSGKLITWGSADDLGQSYVTSGKHGVGAIEHMIGLIFWFLSLFFLN